jgi:transposase
MILNALGFVGRALYLMPDYLHNKPVDLLIDSDLTADDFNDDTLGCCLDDLYTAGVTEVFYQVASHALYIYGIRSRFVHLDSSSFHLHGAYDLDESEREAISITYGYSKDHRPDLKQVVLQLITRHKSALPTWLEVLNKEVVGYKLEGCVDENATAIEETKGSLGRFIVATNDLDSERLSAKAMLDNYQDQGVSVERGFRFLKDPLFFAHSLFLKKPERIMALLMIMGLSLLIYSLAERKLRQALKERIPHTMACMLSVLGRSAPTLIHFRLTPGMPGCPRSGARRFPWGRWGNRNWLAKSVHSER